MLEREKRYWFENFTYEEWFGPEDDVFPEAEDTKEPEMESYANSSTTNQTR